MRFLDGGTDVPDDIINDVLAGRAVFLCGAGISRRVGLLSFKDLTEAIYAALGETRENDAPERRAFERDEFDRVLRALEKRLHRPGAAPSRVRDACAMLLAVPDNLAPEAHQAVLTLSKDSEGRTRLLTTNFDTIFERAAVNSIPVVPSHAGKALPKPAGPRDHGILHLHGRIADAVLGLPETDLILTSADFGDAYLRDGWASQYIEDRMRTGTLVLLGYGAEDAALRLLLETLDVDRERFPDLNKIYALEKSSDGSASLWQAKGIIPVEFDSHDSLYETVGEWAKYAARPADYENVRIAAIVAKAPKDASDFEKEQLRFFLSRGDIPVALAANNPSLAWLAILAELKLIGHDNRWLASWIERNLADPQAVRDVVASIGLFGQGTADVLEFRVNRYPDPLPALLRDSWALVIRQMRSTRSGLAASEWYDLQPRLARGEHAADVLDRLTNLLRPRPRISKRLSFYADDGKAAEHATDLMSIEYKADEDVEVADVMDAWPQTATADDDARLLVRLADALDASLEDAVEVGVETDTGRGVTDSNVPSVADHPQNAYREGFLPIVRVVADLWSRLALKDGARARQFIERWKNSPRRLNHRLALFACADAVVPPEVVGEVLLSVSLSEFFLTSAAVESNRLLRARWQDLPPEVREQVEERMRSGPPADWFREEADVERHRDRARFDLIGNLHGDGIALSPATLGVLADIRARYPDWALRPAAQAGFHSWHESGSGDDADPQALKDVPDGELVAAALKIDAEADFGSGRAWHTMCISDPDRALRALEADANAGAWRPEAWQQLLWSQTPFTDDDAPGRIMARLLAWPEARFAEIAGPASTWLNTPTALSLNDETWGLWDRVFAVLTADDGDDQNPLNLLDHAINVPVGRLTEILVKKLPRSVTTEAFQGIVEPRLNSIMGLPDRNGLLARIRLAADVSLLFDRAPDWTTKHIVPLFQWTSPDALAAWSARRYSRYLGSPALFELAKDAFLQMFGRAGFPDEVLRVYAEWLVTILLANQRKHPGYALTAPEARAALRRAGAKPLPSVGHRLAIEMESAPAAEKLTRWRDVVGPVFQGVWPLDAELETPRATFKLVQLLRATGEAFPEAADMILPFLRPVDAQNSSTVYSLQGAEEILFSAAPAKMLDLVAAIVGQAQPGSVFALRPILDRIRAADPTLADSRKFQNLITAAAPI